MVDRKEIAIRTWKDPEIRKRRVDALQKAHRSIITRKRHSDATKKLMTDPKTKAERIIALKKAWAKPENREKLEKIIQIGLKAANSIEGRKNHILSQQKPELRKQRSIGARQRLIELLKKRKVYSKLNDFLNITMNESGMKPEKEYPIGPYAVDFCFPERKLVVEADGDWWHANPEFMKKKNRLELHPIQKKMARIDKAKNSYLENHGWTVLRFWERDIYKNTQFCIRTIKENLYERSI